MSGIETREREPDGDERNAPGEECPPDSWNQSMSIELMRLAFSCRQIRPPIAVVESPL